MGNIPCGLCNTPFGIFFSIYILYMHIPSLLYYKSSMNYIYCISGTKLFKCNYCKVMANFIDYEYNESTRNSGTRRR